MGAVLLCFVKFYVIIKMSLSAVPRAGKEVRTMYTISSFVWSVAAGIVANFICKWLDVLFRSDKH